MLKNWTIKHLGKKLRGQYGEISRAIIYKVLISNKEIKIIVVAAGHNSPKNSLLIS